MIPITQPKLRLMKRVVGWQMAMILNANLIGWGAPYTDREQEFLDDGYDSDHAIEIAADEAGRAYDYDPEDPL